MSDISAASSSNLNAPSDAAAVSAARPPSPVDDPGKYGVEECCVRTFWAVVERNGTFIRGRNVARVAKLPGAGHYEVIFTSDVSNGVYVATIGRPGISVEPSGEIGVALRYIVPTPGNHEVNKGVWVNTEDSSGQPSDRAFHLVVHTHS